MEDKEYYFDYLRCYGVSEPQFKDALKNAPDDILQSAIMHYEFYPDGNKTRMARVAAELRRRKRLNGC